MVVYEPTVVAPRRDDRPHGLHAHREDQRPQPGTPALESGDGSRFRGLLEFDLMDLDASGWSGEGEFTKRLIAALAATGAVRALKAEDAPASRADAGFSFISNELFVRFETTTAAVPRRRWSIFRGVGVVPVNVMTLEELESRLTALPDIGPADYMDAGMIQFLRAERVVAPYQTRGYKLIELVRVYESGTVPSREP